MEVEFIRQLIQIIKSIELQLLENKRYLTETHLLDQSMNRTAVGSEISRVSICTLKQREQIIGEFRWHIIHINPNL